MSENSKIEWTDHTFNPWIGCTKVSPACDHCYAEVSTPARTLGIVWGPKAERRRTAPSTWKQPQRWNANHEAFFAQHGRRQRVFCASLADVFDNAVDPVWREDLFALIRATPNLDWLLLTKRIGNVPGMISMVPGWLPDNVWLGATITSQAEADRDIPKLLQVPARLRFLSMEPLLGPVDLRRVDIDGHSEIYPLSGTSGCEDGDGNAAPDLPAIDWVIAGGESGPGARPMHPDWARSLRDQCAAAGVPFLFKQWGEWKPLSEMSEGESEGYYRSNRTAQEGEDQRVVDEFFGRSCDITDAVGYGGARGFDKAYYAVADQSGTQRSGMQVFKIGKKAAGRLLDGVQHDGTPEGRGTAL